MRSIRLIIIAVVGMMYQLVASAAPIYGCMDPTAANYSAAATSQTGVTCTHSSEPFTAAPTESRDAAVMGAFASAQTGQNITATTTGTSANLTLTANVQVTTSDAGRIGNVYIVAVVPAAIAKTAQPAVFALGPAGWVALNGQNVPAIQSGVPLGSHTVLILASPLDITSLMGMDLYAGYGVDQNDMLNNGKFAKIYTVGAPCPTGVWMPGMKVCANAKGTNFYQLPALCTHASQQCFKDAIPHMDAVRDGADSTLTWLLFRNTTVAGGVNGLWNALPFRSDGTPALYDIDGGYTLEISAVWTAPTGITTKQKDTNTCHGLTAAGAGTSATCPLN